MPKKALDTTFKTTGQPSPLTTLLAPSNEGIERGIGVNDVATSATGGLISNVTSMAEKIKRALKINAPPSPYAGVSPTGTEGGEVLNLTKSIGDSGSKVKGGKRYAKGNRI